jgi:hypothetical protein
MSDGTHFLANSPGTRFNFITTDFAHSSRADKCHRFNQNKTMVIMAGRPEKMQQLMQSNPGLQSRFPSKQVFAPRCGRTQAPGSTVTVPTATHAAHADAASSAVEHKGDTLIIKRVTKGPHLRVRKHRSLDSDPVGLLRSEAVFAFSEIDGEWAKLSPRHYLDLQSSTSCVASLFAPHDPDTEGYCIISTPDFPETLEEPNETERAAVLEKIARLDFSGEGCASSATLTPEAIKEESFVVGCKVQLAPGFLSCGDARGGPLKPGDVGTLITKTDSRYRVQFNGGVWWYDISALELAEEQQQTLRELANDQDGDFQTPQRAGTCYYRCILAAFNVMLKRRGFDGNICPSLLYFAPKYFCLLLECRFLETVNDSRFAQHCNASRLALQSKWLTSTAHIKNCSSLQLFLDLTHLMPF